MTEILRRPALDPDRDRQDWGVHGDALDALVPQTVASPMSSRLASDYALATRSPARPSSRGTTGSSEDRTLVLAAAVGSRSLAPRVSIGSLLRCSKPNIERRPFESSAASGDRAVEPRR